ncbi:hypothetical protein D9C73_024385 [Collichthys lucidus]|uniref:HECT domain-containing protein n=1 Tax=Collichthys lucidus TaxID=240159 RepID=A0A4U5VNY8_COLLU|nr:hypothetical protein D9C73_024385 [Collichthys lucidus]
MGRRTVTVPEAADHSETSPGVMSIADTAPAESTSRTTQQTNMSPASTNINSYFPFFFHLFSLDDIIRTISNAVITDDKTFNITVSRNNMMERGLAQWQRQKKSSPSYPIKVTFLGEAGLDTGALRKEFFTGKVAGFEERFFESGPHGGRPKYSLSDLDKGHFRTVGEIISASLAQGGPPPNYLMLWCYRFLCTGSIDFEHMEKNDVGDEEYLDLLSRVETATDTSIPDLTNEILNCGYTGQITIGRREEITRAIVLHANLRLLPMLLQIRDGLKLYGLSDLMAKYLDVCQPLFVPGLEMTADADFVLSVCQAEYSETGTNQEKVEVMVMNHLQDFLQELEQESVMERDALPSLSPKTFLQWITGQGHLPVLKEERKHFNVSIKFNHHCEKDFGDHRICYPCVAACSNTITLPVKHMTS